MSRSGNVIISTNHPAWTRAMDEKADSRLDKNLTGTLSEEEMLQKLIDLDPKMEPGRLIGHLRSLRPVGSERGSLASLIGLKSLMTKPHIIKAMQARLDSLQGEAEVPKPIEQQASQNNNCDSTRAHQKPGQKGKPGHRKKPEKKGKRGHRSEQKLGASARKRGKSKHDQKVVEAYAQARLAKIQERRASAAA